MGGLWCDEGWVVVFEFRRVPFRPSMERGNGCYLDFRKGIPHAEPLGEGGCLVMESEAPMFQREGLGSFALAAAGLAVN